MTLSISHQRMVPLSVEEDKLLAKIAERDHLAFEILYRRYYEIIFKFSFRLLKCESAAEEVIQETMLQIWQQGDRLGGIRNLESYIKTIARRRAIDLLRLNEKALHVQKELLVVSQVEDHSTQEGIILESAHLALEEGIEKLPDQQRQVYQLCYQQGLKYQEAADKLNVSHGTVQTHMKLALKFLRGYIRRHSFFIPMVLIIRFL